MSSSKNPGRFAGLLYIALSLPGVFAMVYVNLHFHGLVVDEILFGLWLLPLAQLVYRSRFLPRFPGVWLAIDGVAWVILSLTGVLSPQYYDKVFTYAQPASFGEVAFMLWLVIRGARAQPPPVAVSSSATG